MKINNLQTFIIGEGELTEEVYLTLDLIPIQVVFKYDKEEIKSTWFDGTPWSISKVPEIIDKIYTVDVYGEMINMLCRLLNLKERHLISYNGRLPKFNFLKDECFYELQYEGTFGRTYYTRCQLRHALKSWEQYRVLTEKDVKWNDLTERTKMRHHYYDVRRHIELQEVFKKRDYCELSKTTIDNFIKNINAKARKK